MGMMIILQYAFFVSYNVDAGRKMAGNILFLTKVDAGEGVDGIGSTAGGKAVRGAGCGYDVADSCVITLLREMPHGQHGVFRGKGELMETFCHCLRAPAVEELYRKHVASVVVDESIIEVGLEGV